MTTPSPAPLGNLDPATFLARFWQKRPLLVRQAVPGLVPPATPDQLAGLACDEDVESRLVLEDGGDYPWQVRSGPFLADVFERLPARRWTLLVHALDRLLPAAAQLLERFRFVPNWRIDDVMASYASPGGSVGPHVDNYDVFLLQALGRRRWQIARSPAGDEELADHPDLQLLARFVPDDDWVLEPGDLLYLPPRLPHHGVAIDDCMTLSIGFRAPSHRDLIAGLLGHLASTIDARPRLDDGDLPLQEEPGEISAEVLARVRTVVQSACENPALLTRWFGRFVTEPTRSQDDAPASPVLRAPAIVRHLARRGRLERSAVPCFAHVRHPGGGATLFVGGEDYELDAQRAPLASLLTGTGDLDRRSLAPHLDDPRTLDLLETLVTRGFLIPG